MRSAVGRLLLLCLALVRVRATQEQIAAAQTRKLLADRAWFSQIARVKADGSTRASPPADATTCASDDAGGAACLVVTERLQPGATVEGYELVERTALLGVCNQPSSGSVHANQDGSGGEVDHLPVPRKSDALELVSPPLRAAAGIDDANSEAGNEEDTTAEVVDEAGNGSEADAASRVCPLPLGSSAGTNAQVVASTTSQSTELVDGPTLEYQCVLEDVGLIYVNANYRLNTKFDAGSHGEVWKATARHRHNPDEHFVLKRLFLNLGEQMVQMGLREAHFGRRLASEPHVTRFVEYFFRPAAATSTEEGSRGEQAETTPVQELWLVFYDEGISLRHYLYAKKRVAGHAGVIFEPSLFWRKLRTVANGEHVFREIMRQLLQGVAALHARGITHRDIKPSNILVNIENGNDSVPIVKLADFGSAVDDFTLHHLYPRDRGPSQAEETREYQPPEVLFHELGQPYDYASPFSYDLWSVGVVFLEMLLGSPQVFMISPRARAKLDAKLRGKDEATKVKSYLLHVLTQEFCIFQPPPHQLRALWQKYAVSSDGCNFGAFNLTIINRDPLRKGLETPWGIDLMWKLLQWHPSQRIPAAQALEHAFFKGAYVCQKSGRSFATQQELAMHEAYLAVQEARDNEMAFAVREKYELPSKFTCPHCHRHFATVASCEQHLHARKHNVVAHTHFCHFDAHRLKDAVMKETEESTHSLQYAPSKDSAQDNNALKLPMGMALFQGRKKYMEDFLLVHEANVDLGFELYAVSDGHLGTRAAAFVIDNLMDITARHFAALPTIAPDVDDDARMKAEREFAELVALRQTFLELQDGFLMEIVSTDANDQADFSGCTLTVVLYFREQRRLVSANVGDSRAIAIFADEDKESDPSLSVVPLSMDHWPNVDEERGRIESSGGFVSFAGLWRVVGQLAVSRSIGDQHLRQYVTAEPSVFHTKVPSDGMLVVASDGLWETMTNEDVQRFVREQKATAQKDKSPFSTKRLEDMAQDLVIEGYVRGSQDNIALILVEL